MIELTASPVPAKNHCLRKHALHLANNLKSADTTKFRRFATEERAGISFYPRVPRTACTTTITQPQARQTPPQRLLTATPPGRARGISSLSRSRLSSQSDERKIQPHGARATALVRLNKQTTQAMRYALVPSSSPASPRDVEITLQTVRDLFHSAILSSSSCFFAAAS
jgi:hypothetical protein